MRTDEYGTHNHTVAVSHGCAACVARAKVEQATPALSDRLHAQWLRGRSAGYAEAALWLRGIVTDNGPDREHRLARLLTDLEAYVGRDEAAARETLEAS